MKTQHDQRLLEGRVLESEHQPGGPANGKARHGGHGWMMIACCLPMLVIAGILVATGAASPGFLAVAVGVHADDGPDDARHGPRRRR
jgi:hypothetical protein